MSQPVAYGRMQNLRDGGGPDLIVTGSDAGLGRITIAIGESVAEVNVMDLVTVLRELQNVRTYGHPSGVPVRRGLMFHGVKQ